MRRPCRSVPSSFLTVLGFLVFLILPGPLSAQSIRYRIRAYIDGSSVLLIQGNTIKWHNLSHWVPGKYNGHNDPTVISSSLDGVPVMIGHNWYPNWPGGLTGAQFSDPFVNLDPPLPSQDIAVKLKIISARESLTAYISPTQANGYTLGILFYDYYTPLADWYEAEITISPPSNMSGSPDWSLAFAQPSAARSSMNLVFDSGRRVTVMFGGRAPTNPLSDTYEYAHTTWSKVVTPHSPPARYWAGMAYDDHRKRTVLFGGTNGSIVMNDTWEYDGVDWVNIPTPHSPSVQYAKLTYDSCRRKTVLFNQSSETWEYDGLDWSMVITPTTPPRRQLSAIAFDPWRCQTVMFGGGSPSWMGLSDTWEYDAANWTQVATPVSPSGRWAHTTVFDSSRARIVLFGGYGPEYPVGTQTNDTWEYDGATWVQVFPQHFPGTREQHGMAYDPTRQRIVMFGGWGGEDGSSWEYGPTPSCKLSIAPLVANYTAAGGSGSAVVSTGSTCTWTPATTAPWIILTNPGDRVGSGPILYAVERNPSIRRSGSITVPGAAMIINQDEVFACVYSVSPLSVSAPATGGNYSVKVNTQPGCNWTASSPVSWITVVSGGSGTGPGSVLLAVASNSGPLRTAKVTVASKSVSVTESGFACGANDVTTSVVITRGAFYAVGPLWLTYTQRITLTNRSGQTIPGPVYLVFNGLPRIDGGECKYGCGLAYGQPVTNTYCFSPSGSSMLPLLTGSWTHGQTITINPLFSPGSVAYPETSFAYTPIVLSGAPAK